MTANPILLQKKYARIIEQFSEKENLSLDDALSFFYRSTIYRLISEGVSDLHCMSDEYLTAVSYTHLDVYKRQSLYLNLLK